MGRTCRCVSRRGCEKLGQAPRSYAKSLQNNDIRSEPVPFFSQPFFSQPRSDDRGYHATMQPTPQSRLVFDQGTLLLEGWSAPAVWHVFEPDLWHWDGRARAWRCDAWHYPAVVRQLADRDWPCQDMVLDCQAVHWPQVDLHALRPEQQRAVESWSQTRRGVVVMPTGTGKTEVALQVMRNTTVSTLIVSPVRDLMYQWHRRILRSLGYDAGVIGDSLFQVRPVSVTTYDSACIHMPQLGARFELLIFDECHHLPGELRRDAARMSVASLRLGLTATPERSDGRHADLDWLIGPAVYELPLSAVRGKTLAEFEVVRIPVFLSTEEQTRYDTLAEQVQQYVYERRKAEPHFQWQDLCQETGRDPAARRTLLAFRQKQAIEDRAEEKFRVLEDLFRLHAGTPMIVFAGSNAMARDVSRRFLIPCLLSHCGKQERLEVLEGLQVGVYPALVANQVLDEGVDVPAVKIGVVIGGLGSAKQAKQRLGRILRRTGNARATLYEVVCRDTNEVKRSRRRRSSDAYAGTRHRRA